MPRALTSAPFLRPIGLLLPTIIPSLGKVLPLQCSSLNLPNRNRQLNKLRTKLIQHFFHSLSIHFRILFSCSFITTKCRTRPTLLPLFQRSVCTLSLWLYILSHELESGSNSVFLVWFEQ